MSDSSQNISISFDKQKPNIGSNLKNKKWEKKQKEFKEAFQTEAKNLKDKLITILDKASFNISNYLKECNDNLDKFYSKNLERKNLLYKSYISNNLWGNNNIEEAIDKLIKDIISGSRHSVD